MKKSLTILVVILVVFLLASYGLKSKKEFVQETNTPLIQQSSTSTQVITERPKLKTLTFSNCIVGTTGQPYTLMGKGVTLISPLHSMSDLTSADTPDITMTIKGGSSYSLPFASGGNLDDNSGEEWQYGFFPKASDRFEDIKEPVAIFRRNLNGVNDRLFLLGSIEVYLPGNSLIPISCTLVGDSDFLEITTPLPKGSLNGHIIVSGKANFINNKVHITIADGDPRGADSRVLADTVITTAKDLKNYLQPFSVDLNYKASCRSFGYIQIYEDDSKLGQKVRGLAIPVGFSDFDPKKKDC